MALIKCPDCGKEISDKAKVCPNCGRPAACRAAKTGEAGILRVALLAAAALVAAVGLPVAVFAIIKSGGNIQPIQEARPADIKTQAPNLPDNPGKNSELAAMVSRLEAKVAELEARPPAVPEPMAEDVTLEALVAANDEIMETLGEAKETASEALGLAGLDAAENDTGKEKINKDKGNKSKGNKDKAPKSAGLAFKATVLRIADDDTLVVRTAGYEEVKIRLYGLGAPERGQPGGASASAALKPLRGRTVTVQKMGADHYNRIVALVEHDGRVVNADLAAQGRAWYSGQYCQAQPICGRIKAAEAEARAGKKGIWAADEPAPPWNWRR
jgi:endonuclease YncB( thermonuclease family)